MDYLRALGDQVPFFEDDAPSRILEDMRAGEKGSQASGDPVGMRGDRLLQAALFLHAAETHDRQTEESTESLYRYEGMAQDLMAGLREEDDRLFSGLPVESPVGYEDTGHLLTMDRMASWLHLMRYDPARYGFLVTSSPAVIDELDDAAGGLASAMTLNSRLSDGNPADSRDVSAWRDRLHVCLKALMETTWGQGTPFPDHPGPIPLPRGSRHSLTLTLYCIPGLAADEYLCRLFGPSLSGSRKRSRNLEAENGLIGLMALTTPSVPSRTG